MQYIEKIGKNCFKYINRDNEWKSVHTKTITYECDKSNNLGKIDSIECIDTEDGYIKTERVLIKRCKNSDTAIVIVYSPYRLPKQKPLFAGVIAFNYDYQHKIPLFDNGKPFFKTNYEELLQAQTNSNKCEINEKYGYLPLYQEDSEEYKWAMKELEKIQNDYDLFFQSWR